MLSAPSSVAPQGIVVAMLPTRFIFPIRQSAKNQYADK